jgi:hypothetical protein
MTFVKGMKRPPGAGRKKGTPNKRTLEVLAVLEEENCDPIRYLARVATGQEEANMARFMAAKELLQYAAPKLKAVEHSGNIDSEITDAKGVDMDRIRQIAKMDPMRRQQDDAEANGRPGDASGATEADSGERGEPVADQDGDTDVSERDEEDMEQPD